MAMINGYDKWQWMLKILPIEGVLKFEYTIRHCHLF